MRLYKRGQTWWCTFYADGQRLRRSTRCHDRKAAEVTARKWERDGADPANATENQATIEDACKLLIDDRKEQAKAGKRSDFTVKFYESKCGHLARVFSAGFPLNRLTPGDVDRYVSQRRGESVSEHTISKELVALRASLKLARRRGLWTGDPAAVCPIAFAPEYSPRKRWLTEAEVVSLMCQLPPDRAARVAFMVATSARWRETELARRFDVAGDLSSVLLRGTKTAGSLRRVPIVLRSGLALLDYSEWNCDGKEMLFRTWTSARKSLIAACKRAGIEPCTPNDLRRTYAHWMRNAGVPLELIAPAMGHVDTKMIQAVYGRLSPDELAARLRAVLRVKKS